MSDVEDEPTGPDVPTPHEEQHPRRLSNNGRGLACAGCRSRKQRCDRKKPSCSTCLVTFENCVYLNRKPRTTAEELEEELESLEAKYAHARLKAAKRRRAKATGGRASSSKPQIMEVLGEYPINEAFLEMRQPSNRAAVSPLNVDSNEPPPLTPERRPIPRKPSARLTANAPWQTQDYDHYGIGSSSQNHPVPAVEHSGTHLPPINQYSDRYSGHSGHITKYEEVRDTRTHSLSQPIPPISHSVVRYGTTIVAEPSIRFTRETWWDCLLHTYNHSAQEDALLNSRLMPLKEDAVLEIAQDIYSFFRIASYSLHFINVPLFFDMFHHADHRTTVQPALVLSILAYSKLLQSNRDIGDDQQEAQRRERLWRRSFMLRDLAQAAFDASYNAGWIDTALAQAAYLMVFYEISAHPECSTHRMDSAFILLDNVIHVLGLTSVDIADHRVTAFSSNGVPLLSRTSTYDPKSIANVGSRMMLSTLSPIEEAIRYREGNPFNGYRVRTSPRNSLPRPTQDDGASTYVPGGLEMAAAHPATECPCHSLSLAHSPEAARCTPIWTTMPRWPSTTDWNEVRKEEARRLVWSSVVILSCDSAWRAAAGEHQLDLHLNKPENFAVLFPGEDLYANRLDISPVHSGKESALALLGRTMILWLTCVRRFSNVSADVRRSDPTLMVDDSEVAMRIWMETVNIEQALDAHTCGGEKATMYQAREYLFTIRMVASGGFRQYIPVAQTGVNYGKTDRDNAMKWLDHQNNLGKALRIGFMGAIDDTFRRLMVARPFLLWWPLNQIWRAIELWKLDPSLTLAIDMAINFVPMLRFYEYVWPCAEERRRASRVLNRLRRVCDELGRPMP